MQDKTIGIIGGGLCGLTLAYKLKLKGVSVKLIEANSRLGGRIFTKDIEGTKVELGATWLWDYNTSLIELAEELGIQFFPQEMKGDALFESMSAHNPQRFQLPPNQQISYRVVNGTSQFIEKLTNQLAAEEIALNTQIRSVKEEGNKLVLNSSDKEFVVDQLISTIPPQLLVNSVEFSPSLPSEIVRLGNTTHTWMQDSIKCAVTFTSAFWKQQGLSGVGFSHVGPFMELYDHSNKANTTFALMGFLNGGLAQESFEKRKEKVLGQLIKFFGDEVKDEFISYEEKVWGQEPLTLFPSNRFLSAHQNNGHSMYQEPLFNGKFIIGGTETASSYAGYMEGAVHRALEIAKEL